MSFIECGISLGMSCCSCPHVCGEQFGGAAVLRSITLQRTVRMWPLPI